MVRLLALLLLCGAAAVDTAQNCTYYKHQEGLFCRVPEWGPWLLNYQPVNHANIRSLHVQVTERTGPLTRSHLRGFTNLTSLIISGSCASPPIKWCENASGINQIDDDAFKETPKLERLRLRILPLSDLQALSQLRQLRTLHVHWMPKLTRFPAFVLLGMKSTLEEIHIRYNLIFELPAAVFAGFPKLRVIELVLRDRLDIKQRAIADLPALQSLFISFFGFGTLTLERHAFSNITQLQEVNINSLRNVTVLDSPACSGHASVQQLLLQNCELSFLTICPIFLSCVGCTSQTVTLMTSDYLYNMSTNILPHPDVVPSFNITRLEIYESPSIYPFDMFRQLPRLQYLILEHSMRVVGGAEFRRLPRLLDNPFTLLPASVRLRKVRMTVRSCGCNLLEIFAWMRQNAGPSNLTIHDIFFLDCLQVSSICNEGEEDQRRFLSWMDLRILEPMLNATCPRPQGGQLLSISTAPKYSTCRCTELGSCLKKSSAGVARQVFVTVISLAFLASIVLS